MVSNELPSSSPERRRAPRFPIRIAVRSGALRLYTTNISASGTQLICPELQLALFEARVSEQCMELTVEPLDSDPIPLTARVVYRSDIGGEFAIGLHFIDFPGDAKARYTAWLSAASDGMRAK